MAARRITVERKRVQLRGAAEAGNNEFKPRFCRCSRGGLWVGGGGFTALAARFQGETQGEDYFGQQRESRSYDLLQFAFFTFVATSRSWLSSWSLLLAVRLAAPRRPSPFLANTRPLPSRWWKFNFQQRQREREREREREGRRVNSRGQFLFLLLLCSLFSNRWF